MSLSLHFIEPNSNIVDVSANWLHQRLCNENISDLSDFIIVCPTRSAVRSVRSRFLDILYSNHISFCAGLDFITPEIFISRLAENIAFANMYESKWAWYEVLNSSNNLDSLFANNKLDIRDLPAAAEYIESIYSLAVQSDLSPLELARKFDGSADSLKWNQLADLFNKYDSKLASIGKLSNLKSADAALEGIGEDSLKAKTILLIGVSDPSPKFIRILDKLKNTKIESLVLSSEENRHLFDKWGRPTLDWISKVINLNLSDVAVVSNLHTQARTIADAVVSYGRNTSRCCAICCNEKDSSSILISELFERGIDSYSPDGRALADFSRLNLLGIWLTFVAEESTENLNSLIRNKCMLTFLERRTNLSSEEILTQVDKLWTETLFDSFSNAINVAKSHGYSVAAEVLGIIKDLLDEGESASEKLESFCKRVFEFTPDESGNYSELDKADYDFIDSALKSLFDAEKSGAILTFQEALEIVMKAAKAKRLPESKTTESIALLDWIEVFWSEQSHVFLADMNEKIVPQYGDSAEFILPDSERSGVGIRDAKMRHARDAWMLYTLLESRKALGKVSIIVPRTRGDEPTDVSRLLLQCDDSELSSWVKKLYAQPDDILKNVPFEKSWILKVPHIQLPEKLSVSAFKSYLECPFRFYLKYILKMNDFDSGLQELNARQIGTLVHSIFEKFMDTDCANSSEVESVQKCLLDLFDEYVDKEFGVSKPAALIFQFHSLRQYIASAASTQASLRENGWRTIATEKFFDNVSIDGIKVTMRIDRIDQNPQGDLLIIDYKTKEVPKPPSGMCVAQAAHRSRKTLDNGEKEIVWTDLQLPLYAMAVAKTFPNRKITCAHFIISSEPEKTNIYDWDISNELLEDALNCAQKVVEQIKARNFKPNPDYKYALSEGDIYSKIFSFGGADIENFIEFESDEK